MSYINLPFQCSECETVAHRIAILFQERTSLPFDFSEDSLKNCDDAIDQLKAKTPNLTGVNFGELLELGVYVGEVMRKHIGGKWIQTSTSALHGKTQMPYVLKLNNGATVNPIEKPVKRFNEGENESMQALYHAFQRAPLVSEKIEKTWWKFW